MRPFPAPLAKLAAEHRFPKPNADGTTTLKPADAGGLAALIVGLVSYLSTQYARCQEKPATQP